MVRGDRRLRCPARARAPGRGAVDIDLFYRFLRAGARVRYEPTLLVHHARATRAERLARRSPYGYGMGAACAKWLRERDAHALGVFAAWLALRLVRLVRAGLHRRLGGVREELLVLAGTVRGLAWGLYALEPAR